MSRYLLLWLVLIPVGLRADDAALAQTAAAVFGTLRTETLPNGLRVILLPVPGAPVVTTMMAYQVGSADEEPGQTGLSHYLEHLLFKGTDELMPGDIDRITQRHGGANNAYTTEDMTNYHFDFAADRWTEALKIEAARMRGTRIDERHEFEQEKGAVIAELKGGEDRPWDLDYKAILPLLFPKGSPYAHPVIGDESHVRGATAEIIKRHYDKWYHPNNAALVVVGGFEPVAAMAWVRELFGSIPRGELPPRPPAPAIPPRTTQVRKEFPSKFDVARLTVGFNTVRAGEPDDYVLDVIDRVLTGGKTSRLYKALVEGAEIANDVATSNDAGRYPGWFSVRVELLKGQDRAKAEAIVFQELDRLRNEPISPEELQRVRRGLLAGSIFSRESIHGLANQLATAAMISGPEYATTYLDRVLAVTPEDVMRAAKTYFGREKAAVVWSVPSTEGQSSESEAPPMPMRRNRNSAPAAGGASTLSLADAKRVVLPNGLKLLLLPNRRLPIVVAEALVADVRLREPAEQSGVASLVGYLLEEGTTSRSGAQIAQQIEDAGGSLSLTSSGGTVKVLTPDTELGLELLLECLAHPSFPAEAVERARGQLLSDIADIETQPQNRAKMLFQRTVYGDHPFGRSPYGRREVVERLTIADLRQFHRGAFAPNVTTLAIVGDFEPSEMVRRIERLTATWQRADLPRPTPSSPPVAAGIERIITDPTAAQTHVFLGQLGITRTNPDYYKLLVMDNVLGTGPGFTDRLSSTLRDRQGLAYTVTAQITGTASDQPGAFIGYVGTFPDKYIWVRESFVKEIRRIRDEPPTHQEVEDAKNYLLGRLPFKLATLQDMATQLLTAERYGLGLDFLEDYRRQVAAVTPADVQAVARKYLAPDTFAIIAVGPIDPQGQPLATKAQAK